MTNKKEIMKMAHKLAKTFTGNYQARLALALKITWALVKRATRNTMDMFNRVEMFYGEYKNNYKNNMKGEYNAETKTIEVYVLKDEFLTEAATLLEDKLNKIGKSEIAPASKKEEGNKYMAYLTSHYHTSGKTIIKRLAEIRAARA